MNKDTPPTDSPSTLSRSAMLTKFLLTFIPLALLLFLGSAIFFSIERNALQKIIRNQEIASLHKQENLIKNDFQAIISDLLYLATQAGRHTRITDQGRVKRPVLESEFLEFARYKGIYDQVRLIDTKGMEFIRVNYNAGRPKIVPSHQLQFKGKRYYFTDTIELNKGDVFVSPFDLNIEQGRIEEPLKPMIRFGTPVFNSQGTKLGVIILNYLGSRLNDRIRGLSSALPSSNMLLNSKGYWIISPNREDEWAFMYADRKNNTYAKRYPHIWKQIKNKRNGQVNEDGNLYTFAIIYPLMADYKSYTGSLEAYAPSTRLVNASGYHWFLMSHVPKVYFSMSLSAFVLKLVLVTIVLLVILAVGSLLVANARANRDQLLVEKQLLIDELQDALANIQTLSGLLPICSSCKSIRDDEGYWKRIESYIGERSEAEFSHSICPKCVKILYPNLTMEDD